MSVIKNFGEPLPQMPAKDMLRFPYDRVSRCKILEKNKMKLYYTIMLGGCLYLYENDTDKKWKRVLLLKQFDRIKRLTPHSGPAKDNVCVELLHLPVDTPRIGRVEKYIISTNDERDRKEWMMALFETLLIYNGLDVKSKKDTQKVTYEELEESIINLRKREKMEDAGTENRNARYTPFPPTDGTTNSSESVDENDGYETVTSLNESGLTAGKSINIINKGGVVNISETGDVINKIQRESIYANMKSSSNEDVSPDDKVHQQEEGDYVNLSSQNSGSLKEFVDSDGTYENVADERISQPNSRTSTTPGKQHHKLSSASGHTTHDVRLKDVTRTLTIAARQKTIDERQKDVLRQSQMSSAGKPKSETSTTPGAEHRDSSASRHTKHDVRQQNLCGQRQMSSTRKGYMFSSKDPETAKACLQGKPKGTFLIQRTKEPDKVVLAVKLDCECGRFIFKKDGDQFYMGKRKFESLQQLVEYYQRNSFTRDGERLRLGKGYQCFE